MPRPSSKPKAVITKRSLVVRMDEESKSVLAEAARLRGISVSDFVREVAVGQARREVQGSRDHVLVLTPEEQLELWNALQERPTLTEAQRRLGALMRGEK